MVGEAWLEKRTTTTLPRPSVSSLPPTSRNVTIHISHPPGQTWSDNSRNRARLEMESALQDPGHQRGEVGAGQRGEVGAGRRGRSCSLPGLPYGPLPSLAEVQSTRGGWSRLGLYMKERSLLALLLSFL